jgi:hypothetical protein
LCLVPEATTGVIAHRCDEVVGRTRNPEKPSSRARMNLTALQRTICQRAGRRPACELADDGGSVSE